MLTRLYLLVNTELLCCLCVVPIHIEDSALFLRVLLLILFVWPFLEEDPKLSAKFISLSISARDAEVFLLPDLLGGLRSFSRIVNIRLLVWQNSGGILVPSYPCATEDPESLEWLLRDCEWCPGKSYPWLLFFHFLMEKVLNIYSPLISDGFIL